MYDISYIKEKIHIQLKIVIPNFDESFQWISRSTDLVAKGKQSLFPI